MQKIFFTDAICFFVFVSANGQNTLKITSGDQLSCGRKNITIENASEAGVCGHGIQRSQAGGSF